MEKWQNFKRSINKHFVMQCGQLSEMGETLKQIQLMVYVKFVSISVSGDRVHIKGPDSGQIGSELTLHCSSEDSNPPSVIKWTVDGVERHGTQEEVR